MPKQRRPAELIGVSRPYICADVSRNRSHRAGAVIEHRVDQHLSRELKLSSITRGDREHGGVTTAGAATHDSDSFGIDAELSSRVPQPSQGGIVILERTGKCSLGSKPVID